jgi:hypothetical protein
MGYSLHSSTEQYWEMGPNGKYLGHRSKALLNGSMPFSQNWVFAVVSSHSYKTGLVTWREGYYKVKSSLCLNLFHMDPFVLEFSAINGNSTRHSSEAGQMLAACSWNSSLQNHELNNLLSFINYLVLGILL